ncbi:hypothetical protein WG66_001041 [Moniliophthora roreri]|nr:hypothetical protein WG66_001041 [Moniliophthora roreri]
MIERPFYAVRDNLRRSSHSVFFRQKPKKAESRRGGLKEEPGALKVKMSGKVVESKKKKKNTDGIIDVANSESNQVFVLNTAKSLFRTLGKHDI